MTRANRQATAHQAPDRGDLDRLLDAERRIAERLAAARDEGARIVAEAEASARAAAAAVRQEAAVEQAKLRDQITAACDGELERLAADTRRRVAAYRNLDPTRVADLAAYVVDRVVAG